MKDQEAPEMPREPNMKLKLLIDAKMDKLTPIKA